MHLVELSMVLIFTFLLSTFKLSTFKLHFELATVVFFSVIAGLPIVA